MPETVAQFGEEVLQYRFLLGVALVAVSLLLVTAPEGIAPPPLLSAAGVVLGSLDAYDNL